MLKMKYEIIIGDSRIREIQKDLGLKTWPEFMRHDSIVNKHWSDLYADFLKFQFALFDKQEVVGVGNTVHLNWQRPFSELPDTGLDWAMDKANKDLKARLKSNLLIGVQIWNGCKRHITPFKRKKSIPVNPASHVNEIF
jgi:hypothetical protein